MKCKFMSKEANFVTIQKMDIDEKGDAHSHLGFWHEDKNGICTKFESIEEQWNKRQGFFFCAENEKCSYFESIEIIETQIERKNIHTILDILDNFTIPIETEHLILEAEKKGITKEETERIIKRLKEEGSLFERKKGFVERVKYL